MAPGPGERDEPAGHAQHRGAPWWLIPSALAYFPAVPVDHSAVPEAL
jgi:hypothetical protein